MLMPAPHRSATAAKTPALNRNSNRSTTRNRWPVSKAAEAVVVSADKDSNNVTATAIIVTMDVAAAINAGAGSVAVAVVVADKDRHRDNNKVADNAVSSARPS